MTKNKPKVGEQRLMVCRCTGQRTMMEYTGETSDSGANGHPGWLCLHEVL